MSKSHTPRTYSVLHECTAFLISPSPFMLEG
jgi:hypothetical protein